MTSGRDFSKCALQEIPLAYLREGDRFVAKKPHADRLYTGVASMDGHMVSSAYGFRIGNFYYTSNPDKDYINVCIDGKTYDPPFRPNSTLYASDGWKVLVTPEIFSRYQEDLKWESPETVEARARESKKESLLRKIAELTEEVNNL